MRLIVSVVLSAAVLLAGLLVIDALGVAPVRQVPAIAQGVLAPPTPTPPGQKTIVVTRVVPAGVAPPPAPQQASSPAVPAAGPQPGGTANPPPPIAAPEMTPGPAPKEQDSGLIVINHRPQHPVDGPLALSVDARYTPYPASLQNKGYGLGKVTLLAKVSYDGQPVPGFPIRVWFGSSGAEVGCRGAPPCLVPVTLQPAQSATPPLDEWLERGSGWGGDGGYLATTGADGQTVQPDPDHREGITAIVKERGRFSFDLWTERQGRAVYLTKVVEIR